MFTYKSISFEILIFFITLLNCLYLKCCDIYTGGIFIFQVRKIWQWMFKITSKFAFNFSSPRKWTIHMSRRQIPLQSFINEVFTTTIILPREQHIIINYPNLTKIIIFTINMCKVSTQICKIMLVCLFQIYSKIL